MLPLFLIHFVSELVGRYTLKIKSKISLNRLFVVFIVSTIFSLSLASAAIDVEMILNDGGFVSFDHFKAELYLNNHDAVVPDAWIFGILEIYGEFYYWPDFGTEVNFRTLLIFEGEAHLTFLEFDFPEIDDVIPFGPMNFWGAWYVDLDHYGYDVKEFWLDDDHKWTPTPTVTPVPPTFTLTPTPTRTPIFTPTPTMTHTAPPTSTPGEYEPGDLYSVDNIAGNMRYVPATGPGGFLQGSPSDEPCRDSDEGPQFTHVLTRTIAVMETEITRQMWADLKAVQPTLPADPSHTPSSPTMAHPVQLNTWYESVLFANLLSVQNGYTRCYYTDSGFTTPIDSSNYTVGPFYCDFDSDGYRLASEGEWEYFTRAGTTDPFSCEETNYTTGNCGTCTAGTHPTLEQYCVYCANDPGMCAVAGSKLSNPWNLKDVHGNVMEWCWDRWASTYPGSDETDYTGPDTGSDRVIRDGSWDIGALLCRSAGRGYLTPGFRFFPLGFRLARSVLE